MFGCFVYRNSSILIHSIWSWTWTLSSLLLLVESFSFPDHGFMTCIEIFGMITICMWGIISFKLSKSLLCRNLDCWRSSQCSSAIETILSNSRAVWVLDESSFSISGASSKWKIRIIYISSLRILFPNSWKLLIVCRSCCITIDRDFNILLLRGSKVSLWTSHRHLISRQFLQRNYALHLRNITR